VGKRARRRVGGAPTGDSAPRGPESRPAPAVGASSEPVGPPPPPWGAFPLTEIAVFTCFILMVVGFVVGGSSGGILLATGLLIGSAFGFEQALREHRSGHRPHSMVLAGIPGAVAIGLLALAGVRPVIFAPVGLAIALAVWLPVRLAYVQR